MNTTKRPRIIQSSHLGFTLIEGIIATGIISTALIVGLALAYSNLTAAQANADRVIAGNLAREGIEVMRNVRDSNWIRRSVNIDKNDDISDGLQFYAWDDILDENQVAIASGYIDIFLDPLFPSAGEYLTNYVLAEAVANGGMYDLMSCMAAGDIRCRVQKKDNKYFQDSSQTGTITQFNRRIIIKPICWDTSGGNSDYWYEYVKELGVLPNEYCTGGDEKIGNLVISHVMWKRGNKVLEVKVKEKMYNWRSN